MDQHQNDSTPTLPERYDPARFETRRYRRWEESGQFRADPQSKRPRYSLLLPPPNITGALHLGHAYEHTILDILARFHRMQGYDTMWLPGTDHAGIATQNTIERQLADEGLTRFDLGREAFTERAWEWKEACGGEILTQMRRLGAGPDWSRLTFTMDDGPSRATRLAFQQLYDEGLIYRAERDGPWCPRCTTALSDIESEDGRCGRCATPTETRTTKQWYLSTKELAKEARRLLTSGELEITPPEMGESYLRWCDEMHDWCLSRQLWWGHRIPIWYDEEGCAHALGPDEAPQPGWEQDPDTLDTWFSSGLWPISALGWPEATPELEAYAPQSTLYTGYDLLFFWTLRMAMLCTHLTGKTPFKELSFHGMIRDESGAKMSKSKGNALDPMPIIEERGADTLRLALARAARAGADIPFGESNLKGAEALLKKLWSTTRFALLHGAAQPHGGPTRTLDRWLLSRLERTRAETTRALEANDPARASEAILRFTYDDLSDLWIEASKPALRDGGEDASSARGTLWATLEELLRLLHPTCPFASEELWEALGNEGPLPSKPWPSAQPERIDEEAEGAARALKEALSWARQTRADWGLSQTEPLLAASTLELEGELRRLGRLEEGEERSLRTRKQGTGWELALGSRTLDQETLNSRAAKKLASAEKQARSMEARLQNPQFLARAKPEAIDGARETLSQAEAEAERLRALLD